MNSVLLIGFLVGMGHALEADHLAAVGSMASGRTSPKRLAIMGAAWGLGHTITLFLLCSAVILLGFVLTDRLAATLEFGVGIMLIILGADVLRRMVKKKVHFHVHHHGDGQRHVHAHSHEGAPVPHEADPHEHRHARLFALRPLLVGLAHGAAGSAGLLALAVAASKSPMTSLLYVLVFGVGSMCGMATLTLSAAWPLRWIERGGIILYRGLYLCIGALAIGLGCHILLSNGPSVFGAA
ncbi:MAG TPA: hypothetical protein PLR76_07370 [Hyphomonas sp.]|nr:hypothetical protein [Hyphomonas sp.]